MIDSTGKKITKDEQKTDLEFALAEIKFFIKGFRNEKTDGKALNIAQCINTFLKEGGSAEDVEDYVLELQSYSTYTQSDTLVWELVYIRRLQSEIFGKSGDKKRAAEYSYTSAKLFERICEINPSEHNLYCRILEYVSATIDFTSADTSYKNQEILAYCEKLFIEIEESASSAYAKAGKYLYYNLYLDYKNVLNDSDRAFESIKRAVKYAWRFYCFDKQIRNLDILCRYYSFYSGFEQYSVKEEEHRLRTLISFIKASDIGRNVLKRKLMIFEELLKKSEETKNAQNNPQDT